MARLRVDPWVVEKVLNHATGQVSGVAGVYNRHGYLDEKRAALNSRSNKLVEILSDEISNR
ncbi:MAG: hypothetical protein AAF530_02695 [Pseudomonadota bacterium]